MREDDLATLRQRRLIERATFGARPGELAALAAEGERAWLERQLHPERIADDDADGRVAALAKRELQAGDLDAPVRRPKGMRRASESERRDASRELRQRFKRVSGFTVGSRFVRAVHSRRELLEVMVDFWSNHFAVSARKGPVAAWLDAYDREAIRPHALGRFEDLLLAVAHSPAMLFYLDNVRSGVPRAEWPLRALGVRDRAPTGINENYARELMELHTLGVHGGYVQADVVAAARTLTGWSIDRDSGRFKFRSFLHDRGEKQFLGRHVPGSGEDEGRWLMRELANRPETARFVSEKLARRFVSDDPPAALVQRAAARWNETGGSIAAVLEVILLSRELGRPEHRKLKTPVEFAASAVRATGGGTDGGKDIRRRLATLGELPFLARTPEGYPDRIEAWATPAGMLGRMALAFELAEDGIAGTGLGNHVPEGGFRAAGLRGGERVASAVADPEFQWQ